MAQRRYINNQTQRFFFSTLTLQKEDIDADIFPNPLAAGLRPVNCGPVLGNDEAFAKDVVGNMGQSVKMMLGQFDTLRGRWMRWVAMKIDVAEPEASWYVLDDEPQSALRSLANTLLEEVQDGGAWFNNNTVFAFPMSEGSVLRLDVALAENMVKDIFNINELFV